MEINDYSVDGGVLEIVNGTFAYDLNGDEYMRISEYEAQNTRTGEWHHTSGWELEQNSFGLNDLRLYDDEPEQWDINEVSDIIMDDNIVEEYGEAQQYENEYRYDYEENLGEESYC